MITVKKGERTQVLRDEVQLAAFKANGWEVVETDAKAPKPAAKSKSGTKAKGKKGTVTEPVTESEQEPEEQESEQEPEGQESEQEPNENEEANG